MEWLIPLAALGVGFLIARTIFRLFRQAVVVLVLGLVAAVVLARWVGLDVIGLVTPYLRGSP